MAQKHTFVEEGQNVYDLAVQCYGSLVHIFRLLDENGWDLSTQPGGGVVYFSELMPEEEGYQLQRFYDAQQIRVRTGHFEPSVANACRIPEGYVMFQFRIESILSKVVLFFDFLNVGAPAGATLGLAESNYIALINLNLGSNTVAAAMSVAQWVGSGYLGTQGLYATSNLDIVTMYIPKTLWGTSDCEHKIGVYSYDQTSYFGVGGVYNVFDTAAIPSTLGFNISIDPNVGLTQCCDTLLNGIFSDNNGWLAETS